MIVTKSFLKDLVYQVNGAAIEVHKNIGAGLLENVYHQCLKKELELKIKMRLIDRKLSCG
jgi:GxxExxY protein